MMNSDGTFQQDIQCIVPEKNGSGAIFVSNLEAACNPQTLKKHKIGAVITAIKGKNLSQVIPRYVQYLYIPVVDHESYSFKFIDQERKRTNVLVHCMAGVSRSVTLIIAYIMEKSQASFATAFSYVKSKRAIIHPNESFVKQLMQHEKKLKMNNTSSGFWQGERQQSQSIETNKSQSNWLQNGTLQTKSRNLSQKSQQFSKTSCTQHFYTKKTDFESQNSRVQHSQACQKQNSVKQTPNYDKTLRQNIRKLFMQRESRIKQPAKTQFIR